MIDKRVFPIASSIRGPTARRPPQRLWQHPRQRRGNEYSWKHVAHVNLLHVKRIQADPYDQEPAHCAHLGHDGIAQKAFHSCSSECETTLVHQDCKSGKGDSYAHGGAKRYGAESVHQGLGHQDPIIAG